MNLWHLTPDATRDPPRVSPGDPVRLRIGTWPIEPGQWVRVAYQVVALDGSRSDGEVAASWRLNDGPNSYWEALLGPFTDGHRVTYHVLGGVGETEVVGPTASFLVGPKLSLALLWHQHQPVYKDTLAREPRGSYLHPWVRLHALRDYYSMARIAGEHEGIHLTVNLSGSLLWQLRDYLEGGATDRALELTRKPAEALTAAERQYVLTQFFDAHWHNQIAVHRRYRELFVKRRDRRRFSTDDLRDLQMWFNLAWFGKEFREGEVELATGETASVRDLVAKGRGFTARDIEAMIAEQFKILRAVIPLHRALQNEGRIEVATTPFAHPILPLIVDTDDATIDRPGTSYPTRFHHPDDADAQVALAVRLYRDGFGKSPEGMWPAEGAVSASTVPLYARNGVRWIASDEGVLARSGRWGYDVRDPQVLCRPYRVSETGESLSVFFRETRLSNAIGFDYHGYGDYRKAAEDFVGEIKERYARKLSNDEDYVLTVILDGENAWGSYRDDGRPFLEALYHLLAKDSEIRTVTFREYLEGNAVRGLSAHPMEQHRALHELFTGSWIDEAGSTPGVDLGTWIGEDEENRAWELLGRARAFLKTEGATPPARRRRPSRRSISPREATGSGGLAPIKTREQTRSSTISFGST